MKHWTMICTTLLLVACGSRPNRVRIRGQFDNLPQADLILFSPDGGMMTIDTIHIQKGKFDYETQVEDMTAIYTYTIVYPNFHTLFFQAHGGADVRIKGDALSLSQIEVEGADSVLPLRSEDKGKYPLTIGRPLPKSKFVKPRKDAYQIIAFWASWKYGSDPASHFRQALRDHPDSLQVLSYSLDLDPADERKILDRDTTRWHIHCDYKGWASPLLEKYGIRNIPYYLFIDPTGKLLAMGSEYNRDIKPALGNLP